MMVQHHKSDATFDRSCACSSGNDESLSGTRRGAASVWLSFVCFAARDICITKVTGQKQTATGETIVIATGSRPRNPPGVAVDHENILDSDSLLSMTYLPSSS